MSLFIGVFFNLQHTHPGVDKSSQVPGLQLQYAWKCLSKSEGHGSSFWPHVSEMSEMVSLKMGVKFASSLIMGEKLPQKLYTITCRNAISGHI